MWRSTILILFSLFTLLILPTNLHSAYAEETQNIQKCSTDEQKNHSIIENKSTKTPKIIIEYINHATFKITSPKNVIIETDFTGEFSNVRTPDILTMNRSHSSHYTDIVPDGAKSVLKGWAKTTDEPTQHFLKLNDVAVYNIPTDAHQNGILKKRNENSIFVFKIAGLCIGHLGQIQHTLSDEQIGKIGKLDIVMVPIDGRDNLSTQALIDLLLKLQARIVIPMHWNNALTQLNFMTDLAAKFELSGYPVKTLKLSLNTLPKLPTVVTMVPRYTNDR